MYQKSHFGFLQLSAGQSTEQPHLSTVPASFDVTGLTTKTLNDVDVDILDKFINKLALINHDILIKISEIEYQKSDLDKEKFLLIMNDGNYVYITLDKIELVNSYNEIYPTLDGKKGTLYLDSGNHFQEF